MGSLARTVRPGLTALACVPLMAGCVTTTMWNDSILALGELPEEAPSFEPVVHDPVDLLVKVVATPITLTLDAFGMFRGAEVTADEAAAVGLLGSFGVVASGVLGDAAVIASD